MTLHLVPILPIFEATINLQFAAFIRPNSDCFWFSASGWFPGHTFLWSNVDNLWRKVLNSVVVLTHSQKQTK